MTLSNQSAEKNNPESEYISVNRTAYNKLSRQYLQRSAYKSEFETSSGEIIEQIMKFRTLSSGSKVLEIGPGSGEAIAYFSSQRAETVAVDISDKIIEIAKKRSPKTTFINSNILEVGFLPGEFDIIFAGAIIHLFPKNDAGSLLTLIGSWLKEDGMLFINTTANLKSEEGYLVKHDYVGGIKRYRKKWTESEFEEFISAKFTIVKTLYTNEINRDKKWVGYICSVKHEN